MTDPIDCLVVGAGPAGLTAALYLARFRLSVRIVDAAESRCATIPRTHNQPAHPGGIPGAELLARMAAQAADHGVTVERGTIAHLTRADDGLFTAPGIRARAVLLATGVANHRPRMDPTEHDRAVAAGRIRYCPVCDGYEVIDRRIAVLGTATHGIDEARFLRSFSGDVTLIAPDAPHALSDADRERAVEAGIALVDGPHAPLTFDAGGITVPTPAGPLVFDTLYPALGSAIRSELAVALGADATEDGCLTVDEHQRTSVSGLYAAGDVVRGLDQIAHAMGQAAVAATAIRNDLAAHRPILRRA